MGARNTDPESSHDSSDRFEESGKASALRDVIEQLLRKAGTRGLTQSETSALIPQHKASAITPRFVEMEKPGRITRVFVGYGRRTKAHPEGVPQYLQRRDEHTGESVNIYYLPEFAPL